MLSQYCTIDEKIIAEFVEKKSRFIASIYRVENEEDSIKKLNEVKKENRDARHNVYAYRIANGTERYSDDGEPSGTAGLPILNILRGKDLQNVIVIVTRYFGGILLGTGGLMHAYSEATKCALEKAKFKNMALHVQYEINICYDMYDIFEHYCRKNDIKIINSNFFDVIKLEVVLKKEKEEVFLKEIKEGFNQKVKVAVVNSRFYA